TLARSGREDVVEQCRLRAIADQVRVAQAAVVIDARGLEHLALRQDQLDRRLRLRGALDRLGQPAGFVGEPARLTTMHAWRCRDSITHMRPASRWKAVASRRPASGCQTSATSYSRPWIRLAVETTRSSGLQPARDSA